MNKPILDPRTKEALMEQVRSRAASFAPQWRYEPGDPNDPGAAIAALFGELFSQTVDRFNQLPEKYYTEFLNLLGASSPGVTPASGLVRFEAEAASEPVAVPEGTEIFAPDEQGGGSDVIFATKRRIEVTPAKLLDVYYADPADDRIERLDLSREQPFFAPAGGENLQRHRFALSNNRVLSVSGSCRVELELRQSTRFLETGTAAMLADESFARWSYFDGSSVLPFDRVTAEGSRIVLFKEGKAALSPEEDGLIYIYCDVGPGAQGSVVLSGVRMRSAMNQSVPADSLANNDVPISRQEGGYCFGRRPMPYELFYLRSDLVLCKRGARAEMELDIVPVVVSSVGDEPQYEFNRRIINKSDAVRVVPDDVFVEQVVWEYYNGTGWRELSVSGNENPFSCKQTGRLTIAFDVPEDLSPAQVNAQEGYYIRARVVNVENYLSAVPRWILPFVRSVSCRYQYPLLRPVQAVRAENNAKTAAILEAGSVTDWNLAVYEPLPPHPRAMYLRFDRSPHAMPLSLLFEVVGETVLSSKILFEAHRRGEFVPVRAVDQTQNLRYSATAFLYLSEPLEETELFGETGCWLRMSLSSFAEEGLHPPKVTGVKLNIVEAEQRQKGAAQVFDTAVYEAGKTVELLEKPVLQAEVWVDEGEALSTAEKAALQKEHPELVQTQSGEDETERFWVRWSAAENLLLCGPQERVYALDECAGTLHFGNGINGRVPPRGSGNIRVSYYYGGGRRGNLPAGRVNALVGSVPRITAVSNIVPMSGGTDRPPQAKTEALGSTRIRHRERALGTLDFEQMTLSHFERVSHAKCFANTDASGKPAGGHVCLVVMGRDLMDERMRSTLCREIYAYLAQRCDCNLTAGGRLHVVPSTEVTVSVRAVVQLRDLDQAAVTQQALSAHIAALIEKTWRAREIGGQIDLTELYRTIKAEPNVRSVGQVLCEGSYYSEGRRCLCALDGDTALPFATVRSGTHVIRIG